MKTYAVYFMASASGVLYVGVTNHLDRRVFEHKNGAVPGFTSPYKTHKLVYFELFSDVRAAIAREKELKGWLRRRKVANRIHQSSMARPQPSPSRPCAGAARAARHAAASP